MLYSLVSRILAGDVTRSQNVVWAVLICSLVAVSTYILWSRWTSSIQRQRDNESMDTLAPKDGASKSNRGNTPEGRAIISDDQDGNTLEAVSSSKNRAALESDGATARRQADSASKRNTNYTVGWICAISTEHVAAQLFLDERHEGPEYVSPNDNNDYVLGRIGKHNVVIAVLPDGEYGISPATGVARDMLHSFPNVRIGLMVGIGGGAPSQKHDIRLGDVVVSAPREGNGGVFQYDFGKTIEGQSFRTTGFLNQPPTLLRTAVNGLKTQYEIHGHQLEEAINSLLQKNPRLQHKYRRPNLSSDRLYRTGVTHPVNNETSCEASCGIDPTKLIPRRHRTKDEDNPVIHYGLIASANSLMKNASIRDKLSAGNGVLCFEMEAAGLMNQFPCLVIRGICDYSDTHKNKEWQGYAAMAAAAYAKDLLYRIAPNSVEAEKKITDLLSGLHKVAEEHLNVGKESRDIAKQTGDTAKEQLQLHKDLAKEGLSQDEQRKRQRCHQLFRLTVNSRDVSYEWYKDRVDDRVENTCLWFLTHKNYQAWLEQESGPILVTADPGCGKSVLAKYLIDHGLPQSSTICYFFFKDQDQNTVRQALCALLHQLFEHKPSLIGHAVTQYDKDGQGLINSTESLWKVLRNAVKDPQAGPIIVVLDALDECAESEFVDLVRNVASQFRNNQLGHGKLKYLLTSRPYEQIVSEFRGLLQNFPNIRIPGEKESEIISQEVNRVITHRVNQLSEKQRLSLEVKSLLEKRLQETTNRTYLWVYLVFDYLEKEYFKKTIKGVESAVVKLPRNIYEAYEKILSKSKDDPMVRKALSIILAGSRPLTLAEMNIALNIDATSQSIQDLDLEDEEDFKSRLRSSCGLFVSIYHDKIYLLHHTAREFLLADLASPTIVPSGGQWYRSITIVQAHAVIADLCVRYLNFLNSDISIVTDANGDVSPSINSRLFLAYSAKSWGAHFREAKIIDDAAIIPFALKICDPHSKSYSIWFRMYCHTNKEWTIENFTSLMVASYFGHEAVVKLLLDKGAEVDSKDEYGRTALSWAAEHGHKAVVKLLLDNGAEVDSKDSEYGKTPLLWAVERGHEAVVKLLLDKGAEVDLEDSECSGTPLSCAAEHGHKAIVKLLLDKGAEVDSKDSKYGQTPLSWAARDGDEAVVKLLLDKGAEVNSKDKHSQTPLSWGAESGHKAVVKLLLDNGAEVDSKDSKYGQTPLLWAARDGDEAVVKLLLDKGAEVDSKDKHGRTPLSWAAESGHKAVVKLLLDNGAEVDSKDSKYGQTPLSWAARGGDEAVVKLLLDKGAEVDSKNKHSQTPLSWAAKNRYKAIVKLLLDKGAEVDSKDEYGRTPLLWAAEHGCKAVIKLLLDNGAEVDSKDSNYGQTSLSWAALYGHEAVVKLLLDKGAEVDSKDNHGRTPLSLAAMNGHESVIKLLLDKGAEVDSKDNHGLTPLSWAAVNGHESVIKLLLDKGAEVDSKNKDGRTPLSMAAGNGHEAVVKLLLDKGAEIDSKNSIYGRTPLSWAADRGHKAIVKLLLDKGAKVDSKDSICGLTPLSWAAGSGHEAVIKLLLDKGAEADPKDSMYGRTPLLWAAEHGHEAIIKLLLDKGAEADPKDSMYGQTPLLWAARNGNEAIIKLLLDKGAEVNSKDKYDWTSLSWAAKNRYKAVVKLLLDKGAEVDSKDKHGRTPLSWAARNGDEAIVKLLLDKDAKVDSKDSDYGRTSLLWAAVYGYEAVVKLLLDRGAEVNSKDSDYGRTPLWWAAENGHYEVEKLLQSRGANELHDFFGIQALFAQ